jgi:hypothetical protein
MNTRMKSGWTARAAHSLVLRPCLLGGCKDEASEDPSALTPAQASDAATLGRDYAAARAQGNWTGAAAIGENLRQKYPDSPEAATVGASLAEVQAKADALIETKRLESLWTYQAIEAGKGVQRSASIDSHTARAEEGEYAQPADAKLILRDHPAWGRSAYLILNETNFRCGAPCRMDIAFDDAAAAQWSGKQADSGHGPALFINDEARFITQLEKSKAVRITLPKGSGHIKSLRFDVAGFRRKNYESAKLVELP